MNSYGSDWTRQRVPNSNVGTDFDLATELGTTLSRSTAAPAPALQRLSFARHPSVIGSSLGSKPSKILKTDKQNLAAGNAFQKIYKDSFSDSNDVYSAHLPQNIDVQAILEGSTSKPFTLSEFKRFLNLTRRGRVSQEDNIWLNCASVMLDFLLDFKSYVEGFTSLSLREQSKSPHPFEIICDLNAQSPQVSVHRSELEPNDPSHPEKLSQQEAGEFDVTSGIGNEDTTSLSKTTPTLDRPHNRKVNWAPSVRSNNRHADSYLDYTGSAVSSNVREGSILKPPTTNFQNPLSKQTLSVHPMNQPMRGKFDTLVSKYLGNSTSNNQPDGLLAACNEINSATIQRAILEGKLTNHPAVFSGIAVEILAGLNKRVLPAFTIYSIANQKQEAKARSGNLCGLSMLLVAFSLSLLMVAVPSPLLSPFKLQKPIPKPYRLFMFPLIWGALWLILKNRFNFFCLLCWRNKFRSIECGWKLDYPDLQKSSYPHGQLDSWSENNGIEEKTLGLKRTTETKWASHQVLTPLLTSLLLAITVQVAFLLLPFLS